MNIKLTAKEKFIMIIDSVYEALREWVFWINIVFWFLFFFFGGEISITLNKHHIADFIKYFKK